MLRRHDVTGARFWGLLTLACVVALCVASPASAAAPPVKVTEQPRVKAPEQPQADQPENLETFRLALKAVGFASNPRVGGISAYATLIAGRHPRWNAWNANLPLANRFSAITLGVGNLAGNANMPGLGGALHELATYLVAEWAGCWKVIDTDVFRPIPKRYLDLIEDGPMAGPGSPEATAFAVFLIHANVVSDRAFSKVVRHDLTNVHLMENPEKSRGEVVRVTGQLFRINRYDPPWEATAEGVRDQYEAWIFSENGNNQPYCVIFTHWPENLPKEFLGKQKIANPPRVTADGYFFKRYKYAAAANKDREAPLIFGHTIRFEGFPPARDQIWPTWIAGIVVVLVGMIGLVLSTVIGLSWWWRRNDEKMRKRLLAARSPEFILPPPDAAPVLAVAAPVRQGSEAPPRFNIPPGLGERSGESGPSGKSGDRGSTEEEPPEDAGA